MHKVEGQAHSLARPPECRLSLLAVLLLTVKCTMNRDPCFQLDRLLCVNLGFRCSQKRCAYKRGLHAAIPGLKRIPWPFCNSALLSM